jgi:signal transduction histidine kinase
MPFMIREQRYQRYQELQAYVGWSDADAGRVQAVAALLDSALPPLIDDFYAEIERHPPARRVITGGAPQIERLKGTLIRWVRELLAGPYDRDYVSRRWQVGWRHVEIGLDQLYTNVALSRLRTGLTRSLRQRWTAAADDLLDTIQSLNKLLDLDLAIIEDAYQSEHLARQQRSERLAAIGQVAGGIAHELRNPLNVVKTSVYYLLNAKNPTVEKTAEHLRRIEQQIGVADGVIVALSNFAKMPVPELRPFSVERCLKETLEANTLPPTIAVTLDIPAAIPSALGDSDQLRIVFGNLIRNARDAMPQGGQLLIQARPAANAIEVLVQDTGTGIAAENLSRITEPLYSTKARGLGLGLALAKAILDKHQASLAVVSEPGKGTSFTVRLLAEARSEGG